MDAFALSDSSVTHRPHFSTLLCQDAEAQDAVGGCVWFGCWTQCLSKLLWHIASVFHFLAFLPSIQISYYRFVRGLSLFSTHKAPKDEHQALADTGTRQECITHLDTHAQSCTYCCSPVAVPIYRLMKSSMLKICSFLPRCAFLWGFTVFPPFISVPFIAICSVYSLFHFQFFSWVLHSHIKIHSCWSSLAKVKLVVLTMFWLISRVGSLVQWASCFELVPVTEGLRSWSGSAPWSKRPDSQRSQRAKNLRRCGENHQQIYDVYRFSRDLWRFMIYGDNDSSLFA